MLRFIQCKGQRGEPVKPHESPFDEWLASPEIREILERVLEPGQRLLLIKGLIPALVDAMGLDQVEQFLDEVRVKARRYVEAETHPGIGHASRTTPGERIGGPTPEGHLRLDAARDPYRAGGRDAERQLEAELWDQRSSDGRGDDESSH